MDILVGMASSTEVDDLLKRWRELGEAGTPVTPEDLCRDRPDLLAELRRQLETHPSDEAATVPGQVSAVPAIEIPGYEILELLGKGGMGVVYRARQTRLKRLVAVKMMRAGAHAEERDLRRFKAEAEAVARLQHPNIVQIFDIAEHNGVPYFAMEYADGGTLDQYGGNIPLSQIHAAELLKTLALAMHHAHSRGIIHRDLKPANVLLLADGTVKITDFGLAKILDEGQSLTPTTALLGTPAYMAPEQAAGKAKRVGPATDIHALGAILYKLLTGQAPFRGDSVIDTFDMIRFQAAAPPSKLEGRISPDLDAICLKCLAKAPEERYASAAELAEDLRRFLSHEPLAVALPPGQSPLSQSPSSSTEDTQRETANTAAWLDLPGYVLEEHLGYNGLSNVYKARQTALDRAVVVKVFSLEAGRHDGHMVERVLAASRAVARLQHPNLVAILDCGQRQDRLYVVEEFIDGQTLEQYLDDGPRAAPESAQLLETVARAAHFLHEHGIIHRNLQPRTIWRTKLGVPKIGAFATAKLLGQPSHEAEEEGLIVGMFQWMAPEQALGAMKEIGPATDVYALGNLLYVLLTGRAPIEATDKYQMIKLLSTQEPVPPRRLRAETPEHLDAICLKCLRKSSGDRYPSAAALAEDLRRFIATPSLWRRFTSWLGRPKK